MNAADKINILILAGTRPKGDPVAKAEGVTSKAFVEIDGRPMIDHVLETLSTWKFTGNIILSMPKHEAESGKSQLLRHMLNRQSIKLIETSTTPCRSILLGLEGIPTTHALLITTADHPLLTHAILDEFVDKAFQKPVDFVAALAATDMVEKAYPQVKRTRIPLVDGVVGGCNLFMLKTPQARQVIEFWRKIEENRKKPFKMALLLGVSILLRYIFNKLSLQHILKTLEAKTGATIGLPLLSNPHAAIDVDKKEDLALVREIFKEGYARHKRA